MKNKTGISYKLFTLVLLVIILSQFAFILYSNYSKPSSFLSNLITTQKPTPTTVQIDEKQVKKASLEKFYKELSLADNTPDYEKLYEIVKPSLGVWISKEEFIANEKDIDSKKKIASSEAIIHSIKVEGNKGFVDRTIINCNVKECTGKNREEDHRVREFIYIDGKWSNKPDKEPSERALKAATYFAVSGIQKDKNFMLERYSFGTNRMNIATHFMAIDFDENLQFLLFTEAFIDERKANASRPIVNYEAPAINYQPPDVNVNVPRQNNSVNCTSNTIGDYTYTNCF